MGTAKLPLVNLKKQDQFGKSTKEAIQSGFLGLCIYDSGLLKKSK